jgi:hypothetical protein
MKDSAFLQRSEERRKLLQSRVARSKAEAEAAHDAMDRGMTPEQRAEAAKYAQQKMPTFLSEPTRATRNEFGVR